MSPQLSFQSEIDKLWSWFYFTTIFSDYDQIARLKVLFKVVLNCIGATNSLRSDASCNLFQDNQSGEEGYMWWDTFQAVYDSHTLQGTGFSLFQHCWGTAPAQHPEVSNRSDKMHQNSWLQTFDRKKYCIGHRLELNYFLPVFVWTLFNGHQASHSPEKSENWEHLIKDIFLRSSYYDWSITHWKTQ